MRPPRFFRILKDRYIDGELIACRGTIVVKYKGYDYGLCRDDQKWTGRECTAVTIKIDGSAPFFTVPTNELVELTVPPTWYN